MSLFPKPLGSIVLPPLPERKHKAGSNWIVQHVFQGATTKAQIAPSDIKGHDLVTTSLQPPYRDFLLRHRGARKIETDLPVLTSSEPLTYEDQPETFELRWDSLGRLETYADTPEKVREAWVNQFNFLTEDEGTGRPGLRLPQIAALHAISAHFAVGVDFDAATVVLPTGTGKTETMLATQVYRRLEKTLVLVPSDALRSQISNKFVSLGVLPAATVVPQEIACPRVAVIAGGIRTADDAREILAQSNVIVALPNALEASSAEALEALIDGATDLIVDEAHHVTAATWLKVRERFQGKRVLQFTATPFRRDGKRIDGKIIFNFKLGDAQAAGYYRPINLGTVEEYGEEAKRDRAIAIEAIAALRRDRNELGLDHLLMARTKTKERAEEVCALYAELAPEMKPVFVYSGPGRTTANKQALDKLFNRGNDGSRIVVCVDMLGEGFDLPNLKVAALHDNHKSLAVTLQFIGRFTRKGDPTKIGEATVIVNIADPEAEQKLADLYAEGADWDRIIKRLSEERVAQEMRLQDVVEGLKASGTLHDQLSLWNLRPALSAQFFRTECEAWNPSAYKEVLPKGAESWFSYSEEDEVLVAVVCRTDVVGWGNYQNVLNTLYDLLIIRWDKESGALCLYSSDYKGMKSERLAQIVTDDHTLHVSGSPIFNILNNVELPLVKSLGSSRLGAISFTSYFGPNVTEGIGSIERSQSELNNVACLGYENGDRVLWGATQRRGKVWQQRAGTISDWIAWTKATWAKVTTDGGDIANVISGFLKPIKLTGPYESIPIAVQWGEQAQFRSNERQSVLFGDVEVPLYEIDLLLGAEGPNREINIRIVSDHHAAAYSLVIDEALPSGYRHDHISGPLVRFKNGNAEPVALPEFLQKDPFVIHYADGTYSYNCYHIPADLSAAGVFDKDKLESWDWTGIPLNKESMGKTVAQDTIQYRTAEKLKPEYDLIFNDDGSGEAADLVCLKDIDDETIKLCLVHCKGAHEARVSQDIRNFYVVCGQAQKSITAKHIGLPNLYRDLKRRHETWAREGATRFVKGDMKKLSYFKEKARRSKLDFEMILVQPGGSIASITDDALRLLATTELYLYKTTQAKFRAVISP